MQVGSKVVDRERFHVALQVDDRFTASRLAQQLAPADRCDCAAAHWWMALANRAINRERLASQIRHHLRCAAATPAHYQPAHALLGWMAYKQRQWREAISNWQELVDSNSSLFPYYAESLNRAGFGIASGSSRPWIVAELLKSSSVDGLAGDWLAARRKLEVAYELCPESEVIRNNLAYSVLQTSQDLDELKRARHIIPLRASKPHHVRQMMDSRAVLSSRIRQEQQSKEFLDGP